MGLEMLRGPGLEETLQIGIKVQSCGFLFNVFILMFNVSFSKDIRNELESLSFIGRVK